MVDQQYDIVVVGGSIAALRVAETVARHAPLLSIGIISDEVHGPYERPPLSKIGLDEPLMLESLLYPGGSELVAGGADLLLETRATSLDTATRTVRTTAGDVEYGALIIATGCEPVIPGIFRDQPDTFVLRRYPDAVALRAAVADPNRSVAIVGAGFIGGEFASTLVKAGRRVALIDLALHPLGRFGVEPSEVYEQHHRAAGVQLLLGVGVDSLGEEDGKRVLVLADDTRVPADVIVVGVGVRPSTAWLEGSGIELDNGIVCNSSLQAAPNVFAAGDVVRWPNPRWGATMRIEHWTNAAEQARVAGINAVSSLQGDPLVPCATVPYFWSDQQGQRIQFAGYRTGDEEMVAHHNDEGSIFLYRTGDTVAGVLAFERRAEFTKIRAKLRAELAWSDLEDVLVTS